MIVVGGVIPPSDYDALFKAGAKAVFGPGTNIPVAAADLLDKLNAQMGYGPKAGGGVEKPPGQLEFAPRTVHVAPMNALLNKAITAIQKLPEAEQEAIAREVLERIEADARWEKLFADPRSEALLERLADEALDEIRRGDVIDVDPAAGAGLEVSSNAGLRQVLLRRRDPARQQHGQGHRGKAPTLPSATRQSVLRADRAEACARRGDGASNGMGAGRPGSP